VYCAWTHVLFAGLRRRLLTGFPSPLYRFIEDYDDIAHPRVAYLSFQGNCQLCYVAKHVIISLNSRLCMEQEKLDVNLELERSLTAFSLSSIRILRAVTTPLHVHAKAGKTQ
jgi:hypothetical protein